MKVTDLPTIHPLNEYIGLVGEKQIEEIRELARRLKGLKLQEINSARYGGGVAEILSSYVPFLRELGFDICWSVLEAEQRFFEATKTLHNFLQGEGESFSQEKAIIYWETLKKNVDLLEEDRDVVTIHDPQLGGLADLLPKESRARKKLIWRCHIHLESISPPKMGEIKDFMQPMIEKYDAAIFSSFQFLPLWSVPAFVIPPFIDPLSEKNRELSPDEVEGTREKFGLDPEKPLITQVSRFDWAKDPLGVIGAFKMVRDKMPCQLLLAGGGALDDPEYQRVLKVVKEVAERSMDIHILDLPPSSHKEINAIQRASQVIVQKSVREGFGLTVTEALWKGKPVVGGRVGGIPLQIIDGWDGFLVTTMEETVEKILYLLKNPSEAKEMGERGIEHVREHFLLPRGVKDHLTTIDQIVNGKLVSKFTIICYHPWLREAPSQISGLSYVKWLP